MNQYCAAPSERQFVRLRRRKSFCNLQAKRRAMLTQNAVKFKDKFAVLPQAVGGSRLFLVGGWRGIRRRLKDEFRRAGLVDAKRQVHGFGIIRQIENQKSEAGVVI